MMRFERRIVIDMYVLVVIERSMMRRRMEIRGRSPRSPRLGVDVVRKRLLRSSFAALALSLNGGTVDQPENF